MVVRYQPQVVACLTLALTVVSGCSSAPRSTPKHAQTTSDAKPSATASTSGSRAQAQAQPAFTSRAGQSAATTSSAPAVHHAGASTSTTASGKPSRASLLGLFGELEGNSASNGAFDGAANIAQVSFATDGACVDPAIDPTGTWIAYASTMHSAAADIYVQKVGSKTLTQITSDPAEDVMPAFGPNGTSIAFASNRGGNWDIYTTTLDGSRPVQITSDADHELHPSWSPDGKMIAYSKFGAQSQRWELWVAEVASPGVKHFLDYGLFPQWCPDVARSKIVFQRARQRGSRDYSIWTLDFVNGQALHPTEIVSAANAALINPSWSPDGSRIAFVAAVDADESGDRPTQSDLWLVNLDGTGRTNLTKGQFSNFQPSWAPDGTVYFVSNRSGVDNIWAAQTRPGPNLIPAAGVATAETSHDMSAHP